ncbi:MAG: outer membrane beta-barrel protein [Desulfuromonadaceae bacterium]|nr:outer membrane beta-barrel protein [Desulfuromonadaceae bacterium]
MTRIWMLGLFLLIMPSLAAAEDSPIGTTKNVKGDVFISRHGQEIPVKIGTQLYQNDRIRTGDDSTVGIIFEDNTVLSLGPETELVIDEYVFAPEKGLLGMFIRMLKGTVSYLSGIIGEQAPDAVRFQLPDATIGLRGTHFLVAVEEEKPHDWSGVYAGIFGGHSWMKVKYHERGWGGLLDRDPTVDGGVGGFLLGYNQQINGMVFGLEADGGVGNLSEDAHAEAMNSYSAFDIEWNGHLRAKFGVPFDKTFFYLAGGLALAKVTVDDTDPGWGKDDAVHLGYTLGAGIEHALTKSLWVRLEYLFDDYGQKNFTVRGPYAYKAKVDMEASTVRVGLSYRF